MTKKFLKSSKDSFEIFDTIPERIFPEKFQNTTRLFFNISTPKIGKVRNFAENCQNRILLKNSEHSRSHKFGGIFWFFNFFPGYFEVYKYPVKFKIFRQISEIENVRNFSAKLCFGNFLKSFEPPTEPPVDLRRRNI